MCYCVTDAVQICQLGLSMQWDASNRVPFGLLGSQWFSFDDTRSLQLKVVHSIIPSN